MYRGGSVGKVDGLHPTYRYQYRMFRKSIDYMGCDKGTIVDYSRNLLHMMVPDAWPFSVFNFIWCEIQSVWCEAHQGLLLWSSHYAYD